MRDFIILIRTKNKTITHTHSHRKHTHHHRKQSNRVKSILSFLSTALNLFETQKPFFHFALFSPQNTCFEGGGDSLEVLAIV